MARRALHGSETNPWYSKGGRRYEEDAITRRLLVVLGVLAVVAFAAGLGMGMALAGGGRGDTDSPHGETSAGAHGGSEDATRMAVWPRPTASTSANSCRS